MSPRIAFLDIDGTIIDANEAPAPSTIEAVRTARANGHLVYICTGRADVEIYPAVRSIGFDGAITAGGGFATVGDEVVISRTMPPEAAERMVAFYESSGYDFYLQSWSEIFPSPNAGTRFADFLIEELERKGVDAGVAAAAVAAHPATEAFAAVRPYDYSGIAKSVFLGTDHTAFDTVVAALGDDFHVITGTIPHLGGGSGEVSFGGVNKGTTILRLLEHLELEATDAIGIGDSTNDLEMLQVCGVGIAMGNATDAVKEHADEVTTAVDDDGVWNAFRRHGLV